MLTEDQILALRPRFKLNNSGMSMVDWFEITQGGGYYSIRSGLHHADGVTKSPFEYQDAWGGDNAKKNALKTFNFWWKKVVSLQENV